MRKNIVNISDSISKINISYKNYFYNSIYQFSLTIKYDQYYTDK